MNKKSKLEGLDKTPTGIAGFDQLTSGGLPARRTTLLLGGPGAGKTVFALQTLLAGAQRGEPGILVSFNEPPQYLVENGSTFGWDLAELEQDKVLFVDAGLKPGVVRAGQFELSGLLAGLHSVAMELGARCIVLDSIDVLLTLLDDRLAELQELFRLRDWLLAHNFTALITANLDSAEPRTAQRHAALQSLADCAVVLDFRLRERTAARWLRVVKYRGSGFLENEFPFVIGRSGFEVLLPSATESARPAVPAAPLHPEIELARKELTARFQALDRFMEMKQAELDFLLEQQSSRPAVPGARRVGTGLRRPGRKAAKTHDA